MKISCEELINSCPLLWILYKQTIQTTGSLLEFLQSMDYNVITDETSYIHDPIIFLSDEEYFLFLMEWS